MTTRLPVLCNACAHFNANDPANCRAFPQGIPVEIGSFGHDHHEAFPGDHGVQFELADRPGALQALSDWERVFGAQARRA